MISTTTLEKQQYERLCTRKLAPTHEKFLRAVCKSFQCALDFGSLNHVPLRKVLSTYKRNDPKLELSTHYLRWTTSKHTSVNRIHGTGDEEECENGHQSTLVHLRPARSHDGNRVNTDRLPVRVLEAKGRQLRPLILRGFCRFCFPCTASATVPFHVKVWLFSLSLCLPLPPAKQSTAFLNVG